MHTLGIEKSGIEKCSPEFLAEGLQLAQQRSWAAVNEIRKNLVTGMTEAEAMAMAAELLKKEGSPRSWHRPIIRFGEQTSLTYGNKGDTNRKLEKDDFVMVDIGPTWRIEEYGGLEYEGDVGETFGVGEGEKVIAACSEASRELFRRACERWKSTEESGIELYRWLGAVAQETGFELLTQADGHRISEFPHNQYSRTSLGEVDFVPSSDVWVLEVHLRDPQGRFGAFYEDILR